VDELKELSLTGEGDAIRVTATVVWKGVRSRVAIDLAEIRLKHRHLGFRLRRPRVLGGVPVPMAALEAILRRAGGDLLSVFGGRGIVVADLRRWLPPELTLTVLTVQATDRSLHVWFGPGSLRDVPGHGRPALPAAGTPGSSV